MRIRNPVIAGIVLGMACVSVWVFFFREKKPVKIGYVSTLTGRAADTGILARNGVILATEQVNAAGGISGRPVKLIIRNDMLDPDVAVRVVTELADEGVVAIIGHYYSTMSLATVDIANREKIVMISPGTATDRLTGIDDFFIRTMVPARKRITPLVRHVFDEMGLRQMACVYDLSNPAFSENIYRTFRAEFENLGGRFSPAITFNSKAAIPYRNIVSKILESSPDGLLIVVPDLPGAMICQHLRLAGSDIPVISSEWCNTLELIENGGPAVEGIIFASSNIWESDHPSYLRFKTAYKARFEREPIYAAGTGYEVAQMLFSALRITDRPAGLRKILTDQFRHQGLWGEITIDRYGDPVRKVFLITVREGRFRSLKELKIR